MSALVETSELAALLEPGRSAAVTVLDVRYRLGAAPEATGRVAFEAGHVPGSAYVDLDRDLADPPGVPVGDGGRHPLPEPARFAEAMRRRGVSGTVPVIVYDDWSGHAAARCRWLLRHHGHDEVRVLDGGWSAWVGSGGAVETGPTSPTPGDFEAVPGRLAVVDAAGAARLAATGVLIDARAPERHRGETEPVDPVAGHVPGAVNVSTAENLGADGRLLAVGELAARYRAAGVVPGIASAVYCGSGVTACHDLLALEVAGVPDAALYPGSWSGWISDPERPVAR